MRLDAQSTGRQLAVDQRDLRQLTFDTADSSWPTLSLDAKLVAYQSDRDHPGRYDIRAADERWLRDPPDDRRRRSHARPRETARGSSSSQRPAAGRTKCPRLWRARLIAPPQETQLFHRTVRNWLTPTHLRAGLRRSMAGGDAHAVGDDFALINTGHSGSPTQRLALFSQKKGQPETREWWSFPIDGSPPRQLNWVRWAGEHRDSGPNGRSRIV